MAINATTLVQPDATTTKPQTTLPYIQPFQQLPLSPVVAQGQAFPQPVQPPQQALMAQNLAPQVLQTAQQKAIQGFSSPTLALTSQATQNLLQSPQQGYDPN